MLLSHHATHKPKNLMKVKHLIYSVQSHQHIAAVMKLSLNWHWWTALASQLSRWVGVNYDKWRNSAVAHISSLPCNWHLVTYRFCKVSSLRKWYLGHRFYVNQWILGRCNVHHDCLWEAGCLINHIFDIQWRFYRFSYIRITNFQASSLTTWSVCPCSYLLFAP